MEPSITGQFTGTLPEPQADVYVFPASYAQQRLWFMDQLEPGSAFYNIPAAVRLTGRLDAAALERALAEIVRRHETLRTTFAVEDDLPVQAIAAVGTFALPLTDLCGLPETEREAAVARLAAQEARAPFDLARGPLFRARLLQLGTDDHVVLLTLHHIISDGWSMGVLVREIALLYTAYSTGRPSPLPDLPIQYADYTVWQRERLEGGGLEQQAAYWQQQLGGELPVLKLPSDRPRPPVQSFRGGACSATLPAALVARLKELARAEDATLFILLLAAFQTLLYRLTGQDDVCVGSPIAGRTRPELEEIGRAHV
jgi:hypothetical protein